MFFKKDRKNENCDIHTRIGMQGPNDIWVGGRGKVCDSFTLHFVAACIIVLSAHIERRDAWDEKCYADDYVDFLHQHRIPFPFILSCFILQV